MTSEDLEEIKTRLQKIKQKRLIRKSAIHVSRIAEDARIGSENLTTEWFYPIKTRAITYWFNGERHVYQHAIGYVSAQWSGDKPMAEFLAHAPDDIKALLDEVDRLRKEIEKLNE